MDVTYTASYPAEAPIVVLKSKKGVTKSQLVELENKLKAQVDILKRMMLYCSCRQRNLLELQWSLHWYH